VIGLPTGCEILADANYVIIKPRGSNVPVSVLNASDGSEVRTVALPDGADGPRAQVEWGRHFLFHSQQRNDKKLVTGGTVGMWDPVTNQNLWTKEVSATAQWAPVDRFDIAILEDDGTFEIRHALSGEVRLTAQLSPRTEQRRFHVLSAGDLLHICEEWPNDNTVVTARSLMQHQFLVNGPVTTIDRRKKEIVWQQEVNMQFLDPFQPQNWPVLIFSAVHYHRAQLQGVPGKSSTQTTELRVYERATGKVLPAKTLDSNNNEYVITLKPDKGEIEIQMIKDLTVIQTNP